ncbi:MAG: flippase [Lachnospiraceae bacterium]|nr:flippase [Lachnospiraceae bacterium]
MEEPPKVQKKNPKTQPSVKKNFIMNAILTISTFVFPLISFPYVSRILLSAGTGKVSFAQSVIEYFLMFSSLGIPTYGVRACARVRDDKEKLSRTAQELLIINVIMCLVSYALLAIAILAIPKFRDQKTLLIIISSTLIFSAIGMEWLYKALEQYTYIALRSIVFNAIAIVAMFLLVHQQSDYIIYGAIGVCASSLGYILNIIHARKYIILKPLGNYDLKQHFKPVLVFFAMASAVTIYTNLDNVMLGFMKTDKDVGYYHAAVRIKTILVALVTSLGTVLLPRVSYYVQQGKMEEFKRVTKKAINFVFVFAVPVMIYFMIFAKNGVLLLSGPDFMGAVQPMQILMPTLLFIGLTGLLGIQILVPLGKEKYVLYSEIAGAVVDLILNAILIPKLGASGAAIGTVVAEAVVLIVQIIALRKDNIRDAFRPVQYWKILIAVIVGCGACFWVLLLNLGNFITLLISAILFFAVYAGILLLLREPMAGEILDIIKRFLTGKKKGEANES